MEVLLWVISILTAFLAGWFIGSQLSRSRFSEIERKLNVRAEVAESQLNTLSENLVRKDAVLVEIQNKLAEERDAKTIASTRLEESLKYTEEQKRLLDKAQQDLAMTFRALSDDALKSNNQAFIDLAKSTLEGVLKEVKGELGEKQLALKGLVDPLEKTLREFEGHVLEIEQKRQKAYGSLEEQLRSLFESQQVLQKETGNLVTALRAPQVRGRWGEISLRRVVELSGMSEHCDFSEQVTVKGENGLLRPDLVIHLPSNKEVVVDSKVPLNAYMDYTEASDEASRRDALQRHARQLRKHMVDLASKTYWSQFPNAPEFVVMFIPGDPFVSTALLEDHTLIEDGIADRVIVATPTTLIALLRAIAFGWRQEQVAQNAQEIAAIGRQVYERFSSYLIHLSKMRGSLEQCIFNFNRSVGSLEGRVLPSLRKFKELGATGAEDLPTMEPIEQSPRSLDAAVGSAVTLQTGSDNSA